ncbi:MAG: hypothetical protein J2P18_11270 [Nocardia sp.]|nr:hypothetical protein [Nocardia sp.]
MMRISALPRPLMVLVAAVLAAAFLPVGSASADLQSDIANQVQQFFEIGRAAVPPAQCGPGSRPESGLPGDVPAADRNNGRSKQGYDCNMSFVGGYTGKGAGITSTTFEHCSYTGSFFPGNMMGPAAGVQVIDAADPAHPRLSATLTEPAMLAGTWESLKVNPARKLLVGTGVPLLTGAGYLSVYDISDCAHPRLLNPGPGTNLAQPLPVTTHEGGFSPDGRTYWVSGIAPGFLSAVDLTDPANPHVIWQGLTGIEEHGFGISPDGNRMYLSVLAGFTVIDISAIQRRAPNPGVNDLGRVFWSDGWATQHSIPVTYGGKPYLFTVDEAGAGGVKLIDIHDERNPKVVNKIKLAINLPQHQDSTLASGMGGSVFAYDPHYCAADRPADPTALACGWESSGIRVFDVRDPFHVREIAYFNPPARTGQNLRMMNSPHAWASIMGPPALEGFSVARAILDGKFDPAKAVSPRSGMVVGGDVSTDWCFAPPEWHGTQLWTSCNDNGFMILQLNNRVYSPPANQHSIVGS